MNQHQMQSRLTNMQLQQEETLKALSNKEREVMQLKETALKLQGIIDFLSMELKQDTEGDHSIDLNASQS
jgi:hypothetical protein